MKCNTYFVMSDISANLIGNDFIQQQNNQMTETRSALLLPQTIKILEK